MSALMRAVTIDAHGGIEQLRLRDDLPVPPLAGAHDVRVRVRAASLNRLDLWVLGGIPGVRIHPGWGGTITKKSNRTQAAMDKKEKSEVQIE